MSFAKMLKNTKKDKKCIKILLLGLDNAGKTSIINKFLDKDGGAAPTFGYSVHEKQVGDTTVTLVDVGGQAQFRKFWQNYVEGSNAIIFVADCADSRPVNEHFNDALMLHLPIVMFCNKCDLNPRFNPDSLKELPISKYFLTSASSGQGIVEGFFWVINNLTGCSKGLP